MSEFFYVNVDALTRDPRLARVGQAVIPRCPRAIGGTLYCLAGELDRLKPGDDAPALPEAEYDTLAEIPGFAASMIRERLMERSADGLVRFTALREFFRPCGDD